MPEIPRPRASSAPRSLVLAFRIALLAVAAGALAVALVVGGSHHHEQGAWRAKYVCPMHPEVTAAEPGTCPICRMELEPINVDGPGPGPAAVKASTYQTYDTVRWRGYGPDVRAPAWTLDDGTVTALLYDDELTSRTPDQAAVFAPSSGSGATVDVRATPEKPEPWDRSTSRVRFRADATEQPPGAGDVGWLRLAVRPRGPPVIPYSAVLEGADGPYVLVASGDGRTLARRPVEIGRVFGGFAAVLSGLRPSERVLIRSAFFLDAERRLRGEASIEVTP